MTPVAERVNLVPAAELTHLVLGFRLDGAAPLLMNAPTLLDPLHPLKREMDTMTSKTASKRTVADIERMARIEWEAGLYYDEEHGPFLPAISVKKALRMAGGRYKLGAALERGLTFTTTKLPLIYRGPRDRDGLYAEGFRDSRPVKNGGFGSGRVMRTRPCFAEWALEGELYVDPHQIGVEDLARIVGDSQRYGVGDYRPEFGLFTATLWEES